MCVEWMGEWEVAAQDITAYKIVEKVKRGYRSPLPAGERKSQSPTGEVGTVLDYVLGSELTSDYPGIYLTLEQYNVGKPQVVLKVTVPKGVMIRRGRVYWKDGDGRNMEVRTINALRIIVGQECDPLQASQPWYVNTANTTVFWNYINTSTVTNTNQIWYYNQQSV